jgi:hypothetical protein
VPAYVPSVPEHAGNFGPYPGLVLTDPYDAGRVLTDPISGATTIPLDLIDSLFAWRIPPHGSQLPHSACSIEPTLKSIEGTVPTSVQFNNQTAGNVNVSWIDYDGQRVFYNTVAPGQSYVQSTFLTHPWVVTDAINTCVGVWFPTESADTATITSLARPAAPTNLTRTDNTQPLSVDLIWTPSTSAVAGYNVYRATVSGGPYTKIATMINTTEFVDTSVAAGIGYYYVVTAVADVESVFSNEVSPVPIIQ